MDENNIIFLSYASPDRERVLDIYYFLEARGFSPWLDKKKISGGQNWDFEIKKALDQASVIIVFISNNSVSRRGYVQREIKLALDQSQKRLIDDIYVIPVILDDTEIPDQLKDIHVIRSDSEDYLNELAESIEKQLQRLSADNTRFRSSGLVRWGAHWHRDKWDGLPGYEASYQLMRFSSEELPNINEITDILKGWLTGQVMGQREIKFEQASDHFNFGSERFFRQNTWEAVCGSPILSGRILSVPYSIYMMSAGAAHPNHAYKTFAFSIDPVTHIDNLTEIFNDADLALPVIQAECRRQLSDMKMAGEDGQSEEPLLSEEWITGGTSEWSDFQNFVFQEKSLDILFEPYSVGPYAAGTHLVSINYDVIAILLKDHILHALGLYWTHRRNDPT